METWSPHGITEKALNYLLKILFGATYLNQRHYACPWGKAAYQFKKYVEKLEFLLKSVNLLFISIKY